MTDDETKKPVVEANQPNDANDARSHDDSAAQQPEANESTTDEARAPLAAPSTENLADDAPRGSEPEVARAVDPEPPPEKGAPALPAEEPQDALFEALWKRVLESWDDDKPHVAILEHAVRNERMPELAGRYRAQKEIPGREERAKKKLDGIIVAATQMLMATKTERPEKAPWQITAAVGVVCVVVLVWVAFKVFGVR